MAAYILIHFLFYAGLPYLLLRTAIRNNNAVLINAMYKYMIDPFRSTNKYNYARLCVYSIHMHFILKPALRDIWDRMRTASLRGHTGRNVGWDFTLERMNLEVAQLLGSNISGERIQEVIRQLNGIRHVRGPALDAFGIGDPQGNEYNGIHDTGRQHSNGASSRTRSNSTGPTTLASCAQRRAISSRPTTPNGKGCHGHGLLRGKRTLVNTH
eukprot:FR737552.1.p1 GENE.FR737552.1~~FR737552.1.p1  ORF type:complete len:212 (+),score=8.20 FR737552.1:192-827(+)